MPKSERFEDLFVWQEAIDLAGGIFIVFEDCRRFSIKNQIERAVVSISANIAEGYELQSNKQFIKYLFIAKASCGEVRSLLILSKRLGLYPDSVLDPLIASSNKLSVMIYRLIESRGGKR